MSYSFRGHAMNGTIDEWEPQPQQGYAEDESKADLDAAREIAQQIAAVLGGDCIITGGGHSNPDRTPEGAWSTDYMNVNVTRAKSP